MFPVYVLSVLTGSSELAPARCSWKLKPRKKNWNCHRWKMIEILAFTATCWWQNQPRFGLMTCLALRISSFCIVTRCERSQWNVGHGIRGCCDWVKGIAFHKMAETELWVISLGWRFVSSFVQSQTGAAGIRTILLREFVDSIMSNMFMTAFVRTS